MTNRTTACVLGALAIGLAATACSPVTDKAGADATTTTAAPTTSATASAGGSLASLLPTPADLQQSKGPDDIADGGIHVHYQVNGAPNTVMAAYKSALQDKGWAVTTIVTSGGDGGGGGATYTGTHGDTYGVFDGGGYANSTFIDVCAWPAKPADPNCSRGGR